MRVVKEDNGEEDSGSQEGSKVFEISLLRASYEHVQGVNGRGI